MTLEEREAQLIEAYLESEDPAIYDELCAVQVAMMTVELPDSPPTDLDAQGGKD
jgi:hypothetical protein